MSDRQRKFVFSWEHGPSPALTYYSGKEIAYGEDAEEAKSRALRDVCRRGCFQPGCITIRLLKELE